MKVINFWAGPGAGKSTTAAGLFHKMKLAKMKTELVTEYAKELVYEKDSGRIANQLLILGKQDQRLRRLSGEVDYVITDSPLPLGLFYAQPPFDQEWFRHTALGVFNSYNNINVYVKRTKEYAAYGRYQTADEAFSLDVKILAFLGANKLPIITVDGDQAAPQKLMEKLF